MAPDIKKGFNWALWGTIAVVVLTGYTAYQAGGMWRDFFEGIGRFIEGWQAGDTQNQ